MLYNALTSGGMLSTCEVKWYRTNISGKQKHFFTTKLTNAIIVDIDCNIPHCQDAKNSDFTQLLKVSLDYRKIDWEHAVASTSGADDWRAPKV